MKRVLLIAFLLVTLAGTVRAEISISTPSIGAQVAEADCVVRAVVASVERVDSPLPGMKSYCQWWKVTLDVREVLYGRPTTRLVVYDGDSTRSTYMDDVSEQLFLLKAGGSRSGMTRKVAETYAQIEWEVDSWRVCPLRDWTASARRQKWITDDLHVLLTVEEFLDEVHHVATQMPLKTVSILPHSELGDAIGTQTWLTVALTDDAYAAARRWVNSSDVQMRWSGAEVLVHKNTPENCEALLRFAKSMPQEEVYRWGSTSRAKVLAVLTDWGAQDIPPLVTRRPWIEIGHWRGWASLLGIAALPALYAAWKKRRTKFAAVVWLAGLSLIAVVFVRSYWRQDAVTWGNWDVAAEDGRLFIESQERAKAGFPSPFIVCYPSDLIQLDQIENGIRPVNELNQLGKMNFSMRSSFAEGNWVDAMFRRHPAKLTWPIELEGPTRKISIWVLLTIWIAPVGLWMSCRIWRTHLNKRAGGFPVLLTSQDSELPPPAA